MSSVRCETWTKEEKDRENLKDAGQVTGLYQLSYNLIYTLLGLRLYLIIIIIFFFLIELKNWNRFSIDYYDTWDGILPQ